MPEISLVIDFLLRLFARRRMLSAAEPVNPRPPTHGVKFLIIFGRISRKWGPLGCWAALSYFIIKTGHGSNVFRTLSSRLAESSFLVRLVSYLFRWFGCETGRIDRVADTAELVGTFCRHAGAAFKTAKDVVTEISSSAAVSGENTTSNNEYSRDNTTDVATEVDSSRSDNDDLNSRVDVKFRIISSIEEGKEIIAQWKEGNGELNLDVPADMPAQIAIGLMSYFKRVGATCLIEGPNLKSILEKELASAQSDLEVATKSVAELQYLMRPLSPADCKADT